MKGMIGIIGSGAMGTGIAQVAAQAGHEVCITDSNPKALERSATSLESTLNKLAERGKLRTEEAADILGRIGFSADLSKLSGCELIIEAIVEDLSVKQELFIELEKHVDPGAVLATNTSSLSITAIAGACAHPERVIGIHFFNPAPLMPLVEIIPGLATRSDLVTKISLLVSSWKKEPVQCRDLPGFIVNRIARPYYGEALRILEEGIADVPTIDAAMRTQGFRMGPFELMDLIGNDINYAVTESVFRAFYFDPRYKPSLTQKRMVEARWLGRKSGKGYYDHTSGQPVPAGKDDSVLREQVSQRIITMLINEAYDALYLQVATAEDIDRAMTLGVNYPKGLIAWGKEWGIDIARGRMESLYERYREDRYRPSPGLRSF